MKTAFFEVLQARVEHFLRERRGSKDPRLAATITFTNGGYFPEAAAIPSQSLFTIRNNLAEIKFLPRDKDSLVKDPIILTCSFRPEIRTLLEHAFDKRPALIRSSYPQAP